MENLNMKWIIWRVLVVIFEQNINIDCLGDFRSKNLIGLQGRGVVCERLSLND